jgi:hypothetical protein
MPEEVKSTSAIYTQPDRSGQLITSDAAAPEAQIVNVNIC